MTAEPVPLTRRLGLGLPLRFVREGVRVEEEEVLLSFCGRMGEVSREEFAELCRVTEAERLSGANIRGGTRDIEGGLFWRGAACVSGSDPFPLRPVLLLGSVEMAAALARFDFAVDLEVGVDPLEEEAMASHTGQRKRRRHASPITRKGGWLCGPGKQGQERGMAVRTRQDEREIWGCADGRNGQCVFRSVRRSRTNER